MMNVTPKTFKGKVVRKQIAKGSKSDRVANIMLTECGKEFVLRQQGGNAFEDPALDALEGKTITATGMVNSYVLVLDSFFEIEKEESKDKK